MFSQCFTISLTACLQLSFMTIVYPALTLAYLGQGARLIADGEAVFSNIFYQTIPGPRNGPLFWCVHSFVQIYRRRTLFQDCLCVRDFGYSDYLTPPLSPVTCLHIFKIIASQAMITATFSLVQQVINMKGFPPIRMLYTSDTIQGQVYIPAINWALMIATIVAVAVFSNLANLTNAYGFAVATVMFSTSILLAVQMYYVKHWTILIAVGYFLIFGFFDGMYRAQNRITPVSFVGKVFSGEPP